METGSIKISKITGSKAIVSSSNRAGHRAPLRSLGLTDDDFERQFIGTANS